MVLRHRCLSVHPLRELLPMNFNIPNLDGSYRVLSTGSLPEKGGPFSWTSPGPGKFFVFAGMLSMHISGVVVYGLQGQCEYAFSEDTNLTYYPVDIWTGAWLS